MKPFENPSSRRSYELFFLIVILIVGALLRLVAIAKFNHSPESDELAYIDMATNLARGHGIVDSLGNHAFYNVGYSMFFLFPIFHLFGIDFFAARLGNVLLGALSIIFCYTIAKEAGAERFGRLLAAVLWAVYLPASVYAVYLDKENLLIPLMLGVVWCAMRIRNVPRFRTAGICGALFGFIALTGNAGLCLFSSVIVSVFLAKTSVIRKLYLLSFVVIMGSLTALPWVIRNTLVLGAPVLNTNGGFNLYLGNNPNATGMFVSIADTPIGPKWNELRREKGELQASNILQADAIIWIRRHPYHFIVLAFRKAAYFWSPPFHKGKYPESHLENIIRFMWAMQYIFLITICVINILFKQSKNSSSLIMWISIASYTTVHMLFYVIFRYRLPIMPIVCVISAITLEALYRFWRSRISRESV